MFKNFLVPVDGSPFSEAVLPQIRTLARFVLGSVATKIVNASPVPVLLVRPQET